MLIYNPKSNWWIFPNDCGSQHFWCMWAIVYSAPSFRHNSIVWNWFWSFVSMPWSPIRLFRHFPSPALFGTIAMPAMVHLLSMLCCCSIDSPDRHPALNYCLLSTPTSNLKWMKAKIKLVFVAKDKPAHTYQTIIFFIVAHKIVIFFEIRHGCC